MRSSGNDIWKFLAKGRNLVKVLYEIGGSGSYVRHGELRNALAIKRVVYESTLRQALTWGWVRIMVGYGVALTPLGRKEAVAMAARRRILYRLVARMLRRPIAMIKADVDRMEHSLSSRFLEAAAKAMELPATALEPNIVVDTAATIGHNHTKGGS